jgi:hypothetical protein
MGMEGDSKKGERGHYRGREVFENEIHQKTLSRRRNTATHEFLEHTPIQSPFRLPAKVIFLNS